jgi:putative two-component sensor
MSGTIEDFKNFFNPNMPKSEFDAKQAIEQACKILNAALKKHVINVKVEIKENFTLYGNINELIQILINIINNAKEAFLNLPQERAQANRRQIVITALLQNGERAITLENNAGNINKAVINKIFKPHFTTKKSGSGLGLYMSKVIAEKNNARIYAQNINNGVVFTIKFKNS